MTSRFVLEPLLRPGGHVVWSISRARGPVLAVIDTEGGGAIVAEEVLRTEALDALIGALSDWYAVRYRHLSRHELRRELESQQSVAPEVATQVRRRKVVRPRRAAG